jgi:hypothetical protein
VAWFEHLNSLSSQSFRESARVHSAVDRFDADGTRVLSQESTNPPIPAPAKNTLFRARGRLEWRRHRHFRPRRDSRRNTIIVMRVTLQDRASNPYYGRWPRAFPKESGSKVAFHCP